MADNLDPAGIPQGEGNKPAPQHEVEEIALQARDESMHQQNSNSEALEGGNRVGKNAHVPQNVNIASISYVLCHIGILVLFGVIMSATLESIHELMIVHKKCASRPKVQAIEHFLNMLNASNYLAFFATGFALHNFIIGIDLLRRISVTNVQYIISSALKCNLCLSGTTFFIAVSVTIFTYHSNEEAIKFVNSLDCIGVSVEQTSLHIIMIQNNDSQLTETQPEPETQPETELKPDEPVKSPKNLDFLATISKFLAIFFRFYRDNVQPLLSIMVHLCLIFCLALAIFLLITKLKARYNQANLALTVTVETSNGSAPNAGVTSFAPDSEENRTGNTSLV